MGNDETPYKDEPAQPQGYHPPLLPTPKPEATVSNRFRFHITTEGECETDDPQAACETLARLYDLAPGTRIVAHKVPRVGFIKAASVIVCGRTVEAYSPEFEIELAELFIRHGHDTAYYEAALIGLLTKHSDADAEARDA